MITLYCGKHSSCHGKGIPGGPPETALPPRRVKIHHTMSTDPKSSRGSGTDSLEQGSLVLCRVTRVETFGIFVRIEGTSATGFIRPREWSWARRIADLRRDVTVGEVCEAKVLQSKVSQAKVSQSKVLQSKTPGGRGKELELSRRLALPDPFPAFQRRHRKGQSVLGQVAMIAKNESGVVLDLGDGVQGFVPREEIPETSAAEDGFGLLGQDWVAASITGYEKRRVRLSVKEHLRRRDQASLEAAQAGETLRYHPSLGLSLENMRLTLQLQELSEPEIPEAVRLAVNRVLIVEDSENVSESLGMIFDHFGFSCDREGTVEGALARLEANAYDLLILDINLPAANGAEVIHALRQRTSKRQAAGKRQRSNPSQGTDSTAALGSGAPFIFVLTATRAAQWSRLVAEDSDLVTCFFQKPTAAERLFAHLEHLVTGKGKPEDDRRQAAGFAEETLAAVETVATTEARRGGRARQRRKIEVILAELVAGTGASSAFVLAATPGPSFEIVAGDFPALDRQTQQRLDISPVGDVLRQGEFLVVPDVSEREGQFKHLLSVLPVGSFAGLKLSYADRAEYALFLLGETPHQLHSLGEERLRTEALQIGHAIAEGRLDEVITENQGLLLTGFLSDSLLHEIKNELQALDDFSAIQVLLGKRYPEDLSGMRQAELVEWKRAVLGVQEVSERLGQLVVLFRNLAGRSPDQHVDVNRTVERLVATVKPFADDRNTQITLDLDGALPGLEANPKLIEQPLLNLMINGVEQVSLSGGAHRRLRIATEYRPGAPYPIRVTVADNGRGVHTLHRDRIFDLFFTTKDGGTGLGLYISRFFVERLGGRLLLGESVLFSGSEFLLELPGPQPQPSDFEQEAKGSEAED